MSKVHLSLYAVLFAIVGLLIGWQGGSALAGKHHRQRIDNPNELAALLVQAGSKKQGQMSDSTTRLDRLEANGDEVSYHLSLLRVSENPPPRLKRQLRQMFVQRMCTSSESAYLLSKNVKLRVVYKDANGGDIATMKLAAADCAGVR